MPAVLGYLEKCSSGKPPSMRRLFVGVGNSLNKWDKRFFVLREGSSVVSYYKTEDDASSSSKPAQGTVTCVGGVVTSDEGDDVTFCLSNPDRTLYLKAGDAASRKQWMDALTGAGATEGIPGSTNSQVLENGIQGTLLKMAATMLGANKWDRRFVVVKDGSLSVYKVEADAQGGTSKPPGVSLSLANSRVDLVQRSGEEKLTIVLTKDERAHTLRAGSEAEAKQWVNALKAAGAVYEPLAADALATPRDTPRDSKQEPPAKKGKKRMGVSAEASSSVDDDAGAVKLYYPKSDEARAFIKDAVADSALFLGVSEEQKEALVDAMQERPVTTGEVVIRQGDEGNDYFVVRSGEYSVLIAKLGDTPVHTYHAGGKFGELALLYNKPRAATIKCKEAGVLYALDRSTFRSILKAGTMSALDRQISMLKRVGFLEGLTKDQLEAIISILEEEKCEDGGIVARQGEPSDSLYIVKEGLVHQSVKAADSAAREKRRPSLTENILSTMRSPRTRSTSKDELTPFQAGDYFGGSALTDTDATWVGTVSAVGSVTLLRLRQERLHALLGDLTTLLRENFQQNVLGSIAMFKALSPSEVTLLIDSLAERRFQQGDRILQQGDAGDTFYIIKSGQVRVSKTAEGGHTEREVARLGDGNYFGEVALLKKEPRMASVTALSSTVCMSVDRTTFSQVLGSMQELLEREARRRTAEAEKLSTRSGYKKSDFREVGILGVGTFGRVTLVEHMPTGETYAIKAMRKRQLMALKQVEHVMNEKALLALCGHPFLINLVACFQDQVEVYMVLELALGGELFSLLRDKVRFDEPMARFYEANVVAAFVHLHDHRIAYRDLKPENLLLDSMGFIKICDFGFAKVITDRTFTLCGTPEYLAPEIISNVGHSLAVDWWAVGILLFEMLTGDPPFVDDDPMALYQMILRGNFVFPALVGKHAKDLINRLLVANPAARLGTMKKGPREIVSHPFFKLIDITFLHRRQVRPPFIPAVKDGKDTSNYDDIDPAECNPQDPSWLCPLSDEENRLFEDFSM